VDGATRVRPLIAGHGEKQKVPHDLLKKEKKPREPKASEAMIIL